MVWHCLKYELLQSIRVKDVIVWLILFPILLGAFLRLPFIAFMTKQRIFPPFRLRLWNSRKIRFSIQ